LLIKNGIPVKRFFFFLLLIVSCSLAKSQTYDNLQVSLLTVKPRANAVYTIFGHTAIRLYDPTQNMDVVLNWGTFDFDKPNFIFRWVKGETDYILSLDPTSYFNYAYSMRDATVIEQVLNISASEKETLVDILNTNLLPENIEYRYNFIFDNCTTRPRDILEKYCGGKLIYPQQNQPVTFRNLIHGCTQPYPWLEFGIDLVIGSGADSLISLRSELFLPEKLMNALDHSVVKYPDGTEQAFVISSKQIIQSQNKATAPGLKFWDSPLIIGSFIFLIYLTLVIAGHIKKRRFRWPFAVLYFVAGIGGCIVATIFFFSIHPCTSPNWNILWLHPLHLIGFVGFLFKKSYPLFRWYHGINFVLLSGFLLGWHWIPQELNMACIPFILCLWIISGNKLRTKN
jgi:hypothetical protein